MAYICRHKHNYIVVFVTTYIYHLACSCYLTTQRGWHTSKLFSKLNDHH